MFIIKYINGYSSKKKDELIEMIQSIKEDGSNKGGVIGEPRSLTLVDLFSGTGAFTRAFENTQKVKCVFANDMVSWSKDIYDANFSHKLTLGDLNEIDVETIPPHDILTGGFPCQPFSIAGKQQGFDDQRSNVFWKILAILDRHNPQFVVLENVKNLLSHDNGNTFETIKTNLIESGYHICHNVLNTSEKGSPTTRLLVILSETVS